MLDSTTLNTEELTGLAASLEGRCRQSAAPLAALTGNGASALVARELSIRLKVPLVPINSMLTPPEIAHILQDSGAENLVVEPPLLERAEDALVQCTSSVHLLDSELAILGPRQCLILEGASPSARGNERAGQARVGSTLIYTSGTTGLPKGCLRTAAQEWARATELISTYSLCASDVQLIACPLAHSAPGIFVRAGMAVGARAVILPRFGVDDFWAAWAQYAVSFFFLVPTQYRRLLEARGQEAPPPVRAAIVAGAPLGSQLRSDVQHWLGVDALWQFYGSSETGTIAVAAPGFSDEDGVGRLAEGVELEIRGEDGEQCPPSQIGEMFVRSPSVMQGYWPLARIDDPRGFISVGDLGLVGEKGQIHLVDRKNDTIITGGVNVYPAEVEAALLRHPDVQAAVVVGVDDNDWGQRVVALVASERTAEELRQHARANLAGYKVPKEIVLMNAADLPIGASGKPLRRAAREMIIRKTRRVE